MAKFTIVEDKPKKYVIELSEFETKGLMIILGALTNAKWLEWTDDLYDDLCDEFGEYDSSLYYDKSFVPTRLESDEFLGEFPK